MKKILFIKIGALGDLSFALPAAKLLKESLSCHLTWVVGKTYHQFLQGHSYIDKLIVIDDKKLYGKNIRLRLLELIKLFFKLRQRFDSVIIAHRDGIYYQTFKVFSRGKVFQLVREKKSQGNFVYVPPMSLHESLAIKKLIEAAIENSLGPADKPRDDERKQNEQSKWVWDYSHVKKSSVNLPSHFVILHLGGGVNAKTEFLLKRWPHWEKLILQILAETDLNLVFVGSPAEVSEYETIAEKIKSTFPDKLQRCLNLVGKMALTELVDVIRRCDLFIGVDSGPLHIADSLDKKTIGLFGPTSTISWGLLSPNAKTLHHSVPCSPCYKDNANFPECHYQHQCMRLLTVDTVFNSI